MRLEKDGLLRTFIFQKISSFSSMQRHFVLLTRKIEIFMIIHVGHCFVCDVG